MIVVLVVRVVDRAWASLVATHDLISLDGTMFRAVRQRRLCYFLPISPPAGWALTRQSSSEARLPWVAYFGGRIE
jgi:hypothetical protein